METPMAGTHVGVAVPPPPPLARPEVYTGRGEPELWLYSLDLFFHACGMADNVKIVYADALLRGDALQWRRTIQPPETWAEWRLLLITAFQPINPAETARDRLARLKQTGPVRAYAAIFRATTLLIPGITNDEIKDRFVRGLKPRIMAEVKIKAPATFDEAVALAVRLDSLDTFRPPAHKDNVRVTRSNPVPMEIDAINSDSTAVRTTNAQPYCNAVTNGRANTNDSNDSRPPLKPLTDREREECKRKGLCFRCRKHGHLARDCPMASNAKRQ